MNISRRIAISVLGAAIVAGLVAPAAAQTVETIKSAGTVKVGMLVDFPPFGIMDANNQPDGYDADVAKLLAKELGVEVTIVPVTGPNRIPYLQSNQVDLLVASLGITEERAKNVDFSQPYAGISIGVFGAADLASQSLKIWPARRSASPAPARRTPRPQRLPRRTPTFNASTTTPVRCKRSFPDRSS